MSQKNDFTKSKMVTNKCCCICFTDEKDFLDITLDPGGPAGHPWESEGSNQKLVGFKNVANNSCQVASEQVLCIQFKLFGQRQR